MRNLLKNLGLYIVAMALAVVVPVQDWIALRRELRKKRRMNVAYPGYVWIRQVNERLLGVEEQVRKLDAGQGERVIDQRAEFEAVSV